MLPDCIEIYLRSCTTFCVGNVVRLDISECYLKLFEVVFVRNRVLFCCFSIFDDSYNSCVILALVDIVLFLCSDDF